MKIDHIGYAVKKLDRAMDTFRLMGFHFDTPIDDTDRNVKLSFGERDGYRIELVAPLDKSKASPVDGYLHAVGPMPYHICYWSDCFDEDISRLKKARFKVIVEPAEAIAFHRKRVVFMMNLEIGLIEIVEG